MDTEEGRKVSKLSLPSFIVGKKRQKKTRRLANNGSL